MRYANSHRWRQATFLLPHIIQASLTTSERPKNSKNHDALHAHRVLQLLGRMMATPEAPDAKKKRPAETITDTCFPSIQHVCRETLLSGSSVRRALGHLIAWGFITKTRIPGYPVHQGKYESIYDHCRYWVVPEVWDVVDTSYSASSGKQRTQTKDRVSAPVATPEDQAVADTLDEAPNTEFRNKRPTEEQEVVDSIHVSLRDTFGDHPSYAHKDAKTIMGSCVEDMIRQAGSAVRCRIVLKETVNNQQIVESIRRSKNLGGYLKKCFPDWKHKFQDEPGNHYYLPDPCDDYDGLVGVLQQMWPDHGEFSDPYAPGLRSRLDACIEQAQSVPRLGQIIEWVYDHDPEARDAIGASADPGAYILRGLPGWLAKTESRLIPVDHLSRVAGVNYSSPSAGNFDCRPSGDLVTY